MILLLVRPPGALCDEGQDRDLRGENSWESNQDDVKLL